MFDGQSVFLHFLKMCVFSLFRQNFRPHPMLAWNSFQASCPELTTIFLYDLDYSHGPLYPPVFTFFKQLQPKHPPNLVAHDRDS